MSDIYLAITETPTVVTLTSAVLNSAVASSVTVMNTVTVALDANSLSALENVTVTVGAAITGTVTVGNFPATQAVSLASVPTHAISGTVTANVTTLAFTTQGGIASSNEGSIPTYGIQLGYNNSDGAFNLVDVSNGYPIRGSVAVEGLDALENQTQIAVTTSGSVLASLSSALPAGTNSIGVVTVGNTVTIAGTVTANPTGTQTIAGSVTIGAGTAQIGSVTASLAISSTAITSGVFSSLTSATLVPANTARKMATVYNLGAGQLFVNAGATATTLGGGFMVALSSGDFYECDYTTTTLSAIFATAGTASWVSH